MNKLKKGDKFRVKVSPETEARYLEHVKKCEGKIFTITEVTGGYVVPVEKADPKAFRLSECVKVTKPILILP